MAKSRLQLNLIENFAKRKETYKKRKEGLKKKISELTTLCDVEAFLISFGPTQEVTTWPSDRVTLHQLIVKYLCSSRKAKEMNKLNMPCYLTTELRKQQRKLGKLLTLGLDEILAPWDNQLNNMSGMALRELLVSLQRTLEVTRERINLLDQKNRYNVERNDNYEGRTEGDQLTVWQNGHQVESISAIIPGDSLNQPIDFNTFWNSPPVWQNDHQVEPISAIMPGDSLNQPIDFNTFWNSPPVWQNGHQVEPISAIIPGDILNQPIDFNTLWNSPPVVMEQGDRESYHHLQTPSMMYNYTQMPANALQDFNQKVPLPLQYNNTLHFATTSSLFNGQIDTTTFELPPFLNSMLDYNNCCILNLPTVPIANSVGFLSNDTGIIDSFGRENFISLDHASTDMFYPSVAASSPCPGTLQLLDSRKDEA